MLDKDKLDVVFDNTRVIDGVNFWFNKFLSVCLDIFKYGGLPPYLPQKEIETNLLLQRDGHSLIFWTPKYGVVTCWSELYDIDLYYQPTKATYAQPVLGSGIKTIGTDCEVIYNNKLGHQVYTYNTDGGLRTFIGRYARMMADMDATISIYTINRRVTDFPIAKNDKVKNSLERFFKQLRSGKNAIISDECIIEGFKTIERGGDKNGDKLGDLLLAKEKILEGFFRDLGVRFYNPKKAQVTEDEVESNTQLLVINTSEMLESRREGLERVNKMFGTKITVDLNEKFDVRNFNLMGVSANDNTNDSMRFAK